MTPTPRIIAALTIALSPAVWAATFEEGLALKKQEKFAEAEAVFAQLVRDEPRNERALAQQATLLSWLGKLDASIALWKRAVELQPAEADYAIGLSRVQYWKGELRDARSGLDAVIQRAPANSDALALAGDVAMAAHDEPAARAYYEKARAAAPSADLDRKLARLSTPRTGRLDAGGALDSYDNARDKEGSFFAQGSFQAAAGLVLSGGYEQLHQFGEVDHRLNATAYLNPAESLQLSARAAYSPSSHTVAKWDTAATAELRLLAAANALVGLRHLAFPGNGVTIVAPGVRLSFGAFGVLVQAGAVFSTASATQGFGLGRLEYDASDALHLYAGFSRGAEAQLLLPPATTTSFTGGAAHQLDPRFGVRLDLTHEIRQDANVRNTAGSALTWKF